MSLSAEFGHYTWIQTYRFLTFEVLSYCHLVSLGAKCCDFAVTTHNLRGGSDGLLYHCFGSLQQIKRSSPNSKYKISCAQICHHPLCCTSSFKVLEAFEASESSDSNQKRITGLQKKKPTQKSIT